MRKIWQESFWYNIGRYYVDFCTRASFSSVKVEGKENIPSRGAVMLAPNHRCALMDALLMLLIDHRPIGFGARMDIFRKPRIAAALRWLRILPIARERDGLKKVIRNYDTFDEISDCFAHGMPFCLFSEGTHRTEPGMMPVHKGIFRAARIASEKLGEPVYIVPVGLDYEYFFRQTGKAVIRIGEAFEINEFMAMHRSDSDSQMWKSLCDELRGRILRLVDRIPERRHDRIALRLAAAVLSLPLFVVCDLCAFPIWLPSRLVLRTMKDKAWTHTVYYVFRLLLPLFIPFFWVSTQLLDFYDKLIKDLR